MKPSMFAVLALLPLAPALAAEYPSEVSEVLSTYTPKENSRSPEEVAGAAAVFLKGLPENRRKVSRVTSKCTTRGRFKVYHPMEDGI